MRVKYMGGASVYRYAEGKEVRVGESAEIPDEVLAGSLSRTNRTNKGVRHVFVKANGEPVALSDLKKGARETVAAAEGQSS